MADRRWLRLGLVLFAGCSVVTDLTPLKGDAGDAGDAGGSDATTFDGAPEDAGNDTATADTGCGHTFCDNFDEDGAATFSSWDQVNASGGTLSVVSDGVTPPGALQALINAGPAGPGPELTKFFQSVTKVHVEADVKGTCGLNEADAITLALTTPSGGYQSISFTVYESPGGSHMALNYELPDGGYLDASDVPIGMAYGAWNHYAIDVDFGAQQFRVTRTADAGPTTTTVAMQPSVTQGALNLQIGVIGHSTTGAGCTIEFDDVTVDAP